MQCKLEYMENVSLPILQDAEAAAERLNLTSGDELLRLAFACGFR